MEELRVESLAAWRAWLQENHHLSNGVWLVFYKKQSGKPSMTYEEAIEEALCFGWIDSIIRKIDEESHVRKFTPRNDDSKWSDLNKKRVEKLIQENRMMPAGMSKIENAKKNGHWDQQGQPRIQFEMPAEFQAALDQNSKAQKFYNMLTKTDQKKYITWIATAKRPETREKRINESTELLEKGQKLGLR